MRIRLLVVALAALAGVPGARALGDPIRTQVIPIHRGWNAVFLEVQPAVASPSRVFAGLPVERVACFHAAHAEAQYLRSPGDAPWRGEGWAVWHAPDQAEAFLSNLYEIQAQRAFLILARADFDWTVTGEARATVLQWHPNTCTFTGLPVDPAAPPSFGDFFAGSAAHRKARFFRLEADAWKLIRDPATARIRSGEAYWIETAGGSTYQGPLRLKLPASGDLDFDVGLAVRSLDVINEAPRSAAWLQIERIGGTLELGRVTRDLSRLETTSVDLPQLLSLGNLPAGGGAALRLEPRRDRMAATSAATLLRVTDGRGTEHWVPVRARRSSRPQ